MPFVRGLLPILLLSTVTAQTGATLLRDIEVGIQGSFPRYQVVHGGRLFFQATNATIGTELWRTDGTVAGTQLVGDLRPGGSSTPSWMVSWNGGIYFNGALSAAAGAEFCVTDGTAAGTRMVLDIRPGSVGSNPSELTVFQGALWFSANAGSLNTLYRSDGTGPGTLPAGGVNPTRLTVAGNLLFFVGRMPQGLDYELFVTDGSLNGARLVKDIWPGGYSSQITYPVALGDKLVFAGDDPTSGNEIWVSDGTEAGTILLRDIYAGVAGSSPSFLTVVGDRVVFAANDQVVGNELWVTDGTPGGTQLLKDVNVGPGMGVVGSQNTFASAGRYALFAGITASNGGEPWVTDGTPAGTLLLRDLYPGASSSMPTSNPLSPGFVVRRIGDNQIWFAANDGQTGNELWRTDGTAAGTRLVADVGSGGGSNPERMMLLGANVVFAASTTALGQEPYVAAAGANAVSVGQSCAGGGRNPRLTATDPLLGRTQRIDGSGALVGTTGAVVLGAIANPPFSALGCTFWFDLGLYIVLPAFAVTQPNWTQSLPIPNNPSLGRTGLALQAVCLPTNGPLGFDLTNGVLSSPGN